MGKPTRTVLLAPLSGNWLGRTVTDMASARHKPAPVRAGMIGWTGSRASSRVLVMEIDHDAPVVVACGATPRDSTPRSRVR